MISRVDIEQNSGVCGVVQQSHSEYQTYQLEEVAVVGLADAVVEPTAVMVEAVDAAVTSAAVFGVVLDMRLAHFTVVLEL